MSSSSFPSSSRPHSYQGHTLASQSEGCLGASFYIQYTDKVQCNCKPDHLFDKSIDLTHITWSITDIIVTPLSLSLSYIHWIYIAAVQANKAQRYACTYYQYLFFQSYFCLTNPFKYIYFYIYIICIFLKVSLNFSLKNWLFFLHGSCLAIRRS